VENQLVERRNRNFGPVLVFIACFMFSFGGLLIKSIPWGSMSINSARNIVAALITFVFMKSTGKRIVLNKTTLLCALAASYTTTGFALANKLTSAANAVLLQYTSPVFVIVLSFIFWKQRPTKRDVIMCVCVMLGTLIFFYDSISAGGILGDILALGTAVTFSVVFMSAHFKDSDPISTFFLGQVLSSIIGAPFLIRETNFSITPLLCALALGFILGGGYVLMSIGLKTTRPVQANIIGGVETVMNPVWVALWYDERMSALSIVGFSIVIVSVIAFNIKQEKAVESQAD
jgi:drug/metabolite transporter (DMT)-like permease